MRASQCCCWVSRCWPAIFLRAAPHASIRWWHCVWSRRSILKIALAIPGAGTLKFSSSRYSSLSTSCGQRYSASAHPGGFNMELWSRRKFFLVSLAGSAIAGAGKLFGRTPSNGGGEPSLASVAPAAQGKRPLIISSANGLHALDKGMDILKKGGDTLDAVVAAVTIV